MLADAFTLLKTGQVLLACFELDSSGTFQTCKDRQQKTGIVLVQVPPSGVLYLKVGLQLIACGRICAFIWHPDLFRIEISVLTGSSAPLRLRSAGFLTLQKVILKYGLEGIDDTQQGRLSSR